MHESGDVLWYGRVQNILVDAPQGVPEDEGHLCLRERQVRRNLLRRVMEMVC